MKQTREQQAQKLDSGAIAVAELPRVRRLCWRAMSGWQAEADDLASDVTSAILRRRWRADDAVGPVICAMVRNLAAKRRRDLRRKGRYLAAGAVPVRDDDAVDPQDCEAEAVGRLYREALARAVREALDRLSPRQRQSARLVWLEGLSAREAAAALRVRREAVDGYLRRAAGKLRPALEHLR